MLNRHRIAFFATALFFISAILFRVRNPIRFLAFLSVASVLVLYATPLPGPWTVPAAVQSSPQQVQAPSNAPPQQAAPPQTAPAQAAPQPTAHSAPVIALDPAR